MANSGAGGPAAIPSTHRELTLSGNVLDALQKQLATPPSDKAGQADRVRTQPIPTGKRVKVLFVLVDQAAKPVEPSAKPRP
jgi:hypothetical protein